jgi:hypothetical protein
MFDKYIPFIGLDLPGSDIDIMCVFSGVKVIQNVQHMNRSARHTTLLMEDEMEFPGFTTLTTNYTY